MASAAQTCETTLGVRNPCTFDYGSGAGDIGQAVIGRRINAGGILLQDTFLTFAKLRTCGSDSFGCSGLAGAQIGPESIKRVIRRKSLMTQHGEVADIQNDHHLGQGARA